MCVLYCILSAIAINLSHFYSRLYFSILGSQRDLITRVASQRSVNVSNTWSEFTHRDPENLVTLEYNYRVICNENQYGPKCECTPADDDSYGHYSCLDNGEKQCLEGWTGEACKQGMASRKYEFIDKF